MPENQKTKTHYKLAEEIAYLSEWSEHMLEEIPKYRENLIFYTAHKTDHGLSPTKLATVSAIAVTLKESEESFKTVVKELRKLRGRNVKREKT